MAFHLPAVGHALGRLKHLLATPKGRKTALVAGGGVGAIVLGLRAKKKGGLTTQQTDPVQGLDAGAGGAGATPDIGAAGGGGYGFLSAFPSLFDPFPGAGLASNPGSALAGDPGIPAVDASRAFQLAAPLPVGSITIGLPAETPSGPSAVDRVGGIGSVGGTIGSAFKTPARFGSVSDAVSSAFGGGGRGVGNVVAVGGGGKASVGSVIGRALTATPRKWSGPYTSPAPTVGGTVGRALTPAPAPPANTVGGTIGGALSSGSPPPPPKKKTVGGTIGGAFSPPPPKTRIGLF